MNRSTSTMVSAFCLLLIVLVMVPARAALIVNGSFEEPVVPIGGFTNFLAGSGAIPGWTLVGVDSSITNGTFMQSGITFEAEDDAQYIDLAGVTSNSMSSGVSQIVSTLAGQAYDLSFYVGSATDNFYFYASTVDLSIDGGLRVSYTNSTAPSNALDWKLFTVPFTATSAMTSLTFYNGSALNNYLSALDNVSLALTIPEPRTLLLATMGYFAALMLMVRRKYRSVQHLRDCKTRLGLNS